MKNTKKIFLCILLILFSIIFVKAKIINSKNTDRSLVADNLPISVVVGDKIGVNYYSELARSFFHKKLYLLGPYNDQIYSHPNPYGNDAYNQKIIIQDASFYNGKYYLYFGPLPVVLYMSGRVLTGYYPSDFIVGIILLISSMAGFLFYGLKIIESNNIFGFGKQKLIGIFILFSILYLNPIAVNTILTYSSAHTISRFAGLQFILFSAMNILLNKIDGSNVLRITLTSTLLASLGLLCKYNLIASAIFILILSAYYLIKYEKNFSRKIVVVSIPIFIAAVLHGFYNFLRFDNPFEFGLIYQTNALDFVHNKDSLFAFKLNLPYIFGVLYERTYEYFIALPHYITDKMVFIPSYSEIFKPSSRFYTEGFYSIIFSEPFVLIILGSIIFYFFRNFSISNFNEEKFLKIWVTLFLIWTIFLVYFLFMSTVFYANEINIALALTFIVFNQKLRNYSSIYNKLGLMSVVLSTLFIFLF